MFGNWKSVFRFSFKTKLLEAKILKPSFETGRAQKGEFGYVFQNHQVSIMDKVLEFFLYYYYFLSWSFHFPLGINNSSTIADRFGKIQKQWYIRPKHWIGPQIPRVSVHGGFAQGSCAPRGQNRRSVFLSAAARTGAPRGFGPRLGLFNGSGKQTGSSLDRKWGENIKERTTAQGCVRPSSLPFAQVEGCELVSVFQLDRRECWQVAKA